MSDGQNTSQLPDSDTVSCINSITNQCNYIIGYKLDNSINNGESWFPMLQSSLQQLQDHANQWVNGICKKINEDVPNNIINSDAEISSYFNVLLPIIGDVTQNNVETTENSSDSLKQTLINSGISENAADNFKDNLEDLNNGIAGICTQLNNINIQFDTLVNDFSEDYTNFQNVENSMQQGLNLQEQTITDLKNQLNELLDKISQGSSDSNPEQIQVDLCKVANNPEEAAALAKFRMMMGPGIQLHPSNQEQADEEAQAAEDKVNLNEDVYRYANVLILEDTVNSISEGITGVKQSLGYITICMNTVMQKVQVVNSFVSQTSNPQEWIMVNVDIQAAQKAWVDLKNYAENLQSAFGSGS